MIKLPKCMFCEHYDFEGKNCPAHPEGMNDNQIMESILLDTDRECAPGIRFSKEKDCGVL